MKKFTWGILALGTGVFVASFLFRFLDPEFQMEQYIRLVGARQILHGELPDRDFLNRGYTLMYYAAAAAMAVFEDGLLGDLVLTAGLVSLGAALAWLLSYQASGSKFIAGVAVLIAISSYPALYNYPKIFLPVLGLFLLWRYIDHQSVGRLLAVSAGITVALLFRHDHGLYLGLATATMLACVHLPGDYKMLLQRVLIVLISVLAFGSPYILFLTANDRLVPHVRTSLWQGTSLVDASQSPETTFDIDLSQPLLRWVNDEVRVDTRINIRWAETVSDLAQQAKEGRGSRTTGRRGYRRPNVALRHRPRYFPRSACGHWSQIPASRTRRASTGNHSGLNDRVSGCRSKSLPGCSTRATPRCGSTMRLRVCRHSACSFWG